MLIQECGPDCPECPKDFVTPIVYAPEEREDKAQGPVFGDLEEVRIETNGMMKQRQTLTRPFQPLASFAVAGWLRRL